MIKIIALLVYLPHLVVHQHHKTYSIFVHYYSRKNLIKLEDREKKFEISDWLTEKQHDAGTEQANVLTDVQL